MPDLIPVTVPLPDGLTADKLRLIAGWLDTYDRLAEQYLLLVGDNFDSAAVNQALSATQGKAVQADLRRWADSIDGASTPESPVPVFTDGDRP